MVGFRWGGADFFSKRVVVMRFIARLLRSLRAFECLIGLMFGALCQ